MSYTALYRKYRPQTFDHVKGQDHIVITLQNQIKSGKCGHAYLMCGTRGTGKTTIAKIFAKALNCEAPAEGNPCQKCSSCAAIHTGASLNVIEIDAASNNGVDNIREIREEVAYRPTQGKYKVYIIDEVHMLSTAAENALLKTLEEPPEYVVFILATTDKHKIAPTILSRCQQYDFRRMKVETIANRIRELLVSEQVTAEEKAILYIAKKADGSMRDALSLLDQCMGFQLGEKLTFDNVLKVLGSAQTEVFRRLLEGIVRRDVAKVMGLIEEIIMEGSELTSFVSDFTWHLRNLLLLKTSANMEGEVSSYRVEDTLEVTSEELETLKEEAKRIALETLLRFIRITGELSEQLRFTTGKRVAVEVAFIKLCIPAMESNVDSLLERIRVLEEKSEEGVWVHKSHARISEEEIDDEEQSSKVEPTKEKAPSEEAAQERNPRSEAIEEKAPREEATQERNPREEAAQERNPREEAARERNPRSEAIEEKAPGEERSKGGISEEVLLHVIRSLSPLLGMYFSDRSTYRMSQEEGGQVVRVVHTNETACNLLDSPGKKEELRRLILEQTGQEVELKIEHYGKREETKKSQGLDEIFQENIKFPITRE